MILRLKIKAIFQYLVQTLGLGLISVDAILDYFRSVAVEVVRLTLPFSDQKPPVRLWPMSTYLHWTESALHPDKPFDNLPILI